MKNLLKITTDIFMSLSFIFLMFYNFTGEKAHKFLGIVLLFFTILHLFLNRFWYKNIFKGKYNFKRKFKTAVIFILLSIFILLFFTGIKILQCQQAGVSYEIYSDIYFYSAYLGIFFAVIHFFDSKKF